MNYEKDILKRLLDIYERRGAFDKDASSLRAIQLEVKKVYPEYLNRYNHEVYKDVNSSIDVLCVKGLVVAEKNNSGQYSKIKLNVPTVTECYKKLKRMSIPEQCENIKSVLAKYQDCELPLLQKVINDWCKYLGEYKKLPYDLKYDSKRIDDILFVLQALLKLNTETYIRNFSTALFKDSKRFQKEFRSTVESILFDYTDEIVEKDRILNFYNLYENPTYVLIKGNVIIQFDSSFIDVEELQDGIALSNASLENIRKIEVKAGKVVTVENLTTYHDLDEEDAVHIYLGGYHNHSKQILLEKIYADNKDKAYFHKGDLDVYGFLILENLKEKTGIPFTPLMMDVVTIQKFYQAGLYKELTSSDVKMIEGKKGTKLAEYMDVLQYMLDNDCKVEQESMKAVELLRWR
nr:Wadjet anti-phage system protein JetD domain-containing protein [uncultured Catonella sp.]